MTATLHKLTAGDGYTYLTRQVAVTDSTERGRSNLADYYSDKGERPGRWFGAAVAGLGSVAVGDQVTEAHMRALFGEGRHPDADCIQHDTIAAGGSAAEALKASKLGRAYPVGADKPTPFLVETQRRYQQYNAERGLRLNAAVPDPIRSEIRTEVGRSTFVDMYGRPPADQQELTSHITRQSRRPDQAVAGFDVTFTPVKSVSALWAVAPLEITAEIEAAHEAAVEHALGWLEAEVAHTRRGAQGARQAEVSGILAAVFTHRDSRNGDPNLHTHVAIANKVQDQSDGAWLSLDGAALYRAMVTVSEHYNSHLEAEVVERLGAEFEAKASRSGRRPIRELAGVPAQILEAWSSRRAQIVAEQDRLAGEFQTRHGRAPTAVEMIQLAQQANLATRQDKHEPRSLAEQRASWRSEAVAVLGSQDAVDAVTQATAGRRSRDRTTGVDASVGGGLGVGIDDATLSELADRAVATLTHARARWQPTHVMAEAYRLLRDYDMPTENIDPAVRAVVDHALSRAVPLTRPDEIGVPAALRRGDGTSVYEPKHTRLYTTQRVLDAEQRIVDLAVRRDGRTISNSALSLALLEAEANGRGLNEGQAELVRMLGQSGRRVQLALTPAGSGKTTAIQTLARAWTDSGGTVVGLAPSAVAAEELRAAVPDGAVDTLARLAYALQPMADGKLLPTPGWARRIDANTLVVIDEAGMAGTTDLAVVIDYVVGRGGSVRLIGDDRQLSAVGAGGVLRDVQEVAGAATLTELMRFTDAAEAAATLAVRDGDPAAAGFYLDRGRLHDTGDPTEAIVDAWAGDVDQGRSTLMIVATTGAAAELNERARARRIAQGRVDAGPAVTLRSGLPASVGDEILTRRNNRKNRFGPTDFVKNGDRWTVVKLREDGAVKVRHQRSGMLTWLAGDYTAEHVDHAYAVTVHSAQGSTVDVSHVLVDGTEDRQMLYVALSRGRSGNHVYLRSGGDGDPHNVIKPEVVRPSTGAEILAGILARDAAEQSASTTRRLAGSPPLLLRQHALRYLDGVFAAAEDVAGPGQLRVIDEGAEEVEPGVTSCGGWPLLRTMLATIHVAGGDPMEQLRDARRQRGVDDAHDVAAVLTWRLDHTELFGGAGPLPWLRAVPEPLKIDPTWGPYLNARAEHVDHYATQVGDQATQVTDLPAWAQPIRHDHNLWRELAVWRAANDIPDTDPTPAGAKLPASRERNHQRHLEARIEKVVAPLAALPAAAMQLLHEQEPGVTEDPFWPVMARRLAAADWRDQTVEEIMAAALAKGRLPDEMPAAALWFRLAGQLKLTAADVAPNIRLRPDWTSDLLHRLPDRFGPSLLTSPDWPELVTVVTDSVGITGLPAADLLDLAIAGLNLNEQEDGGLPAGAVPAMLIPRLGELTTKPTAGGTDHDLPADMADVETDVEASQPHDLDGLDLPTGDLGRDTGDEPADADHLEPAEETGPGAGDQVAATPPQRLVELNEAAAGWWAERYRGSSAAGYVRGRLGVDLADNTRVSVGYAPAGWTNLADHLRRNQAADDTELVDAGLAKWSRRGTLIDVMRDRVVFGIRDSSGALVGFTGRAAPGADPAAPKWLNTPTTQIFTKGQLLFGLAENQDRLAAGATPVRVEGVFDALAVTLAGDGRTVGLAPLGTALTAVQADTLAQAARDQLVLYGTDTDPAGTKAAHRDYTMLAARGLDVRRLILTDGQHTFNDPADAYTANHGAALTNVLSAVDVAPPLAGHLIADLITRDDHRDHIMAIVALARQIGPVIAAAPPEDWSNLIEGATGMIADAHHDHGDLDRYREPIVTATIDAVDSWEPLRRALQDAPAITPQAEAPDVSYAVQARDRLNQISATLAAMRQRTPSGPTTEPTELATEQRRHEEEQGRHQDRDGPGRTR